jgi:phenylpropionate dioxygenase-like ring-hydroxylating dioxygenase large terminal subunit
MQKRPALKASKNLDPGPLKGAPQIKTAWYIVCRSHELKNNLLSRKLFGLPLVLFRDSENNAATLLDRCAHRNAPLSAGRRQGGLVQCAYHGWTYAPDGQCRSVPSLCTALKKKACQVPAFATCEQQGYIWVYGLQDSEPQHPPFFFDVLADPGFNSLRYEMTLAADLLLCLENILDVPHTAYLHGGLFRRQDTPQRRQVEVVRYPARLEAHYAGEPVPRGVLGQLLAPGGGQLTHVDRFLLPSVAEVVYELGPTALRIVNFLTPVAADCTKVFTVAGLRLRCGGALLGRLAQPFAMWVARQDATMLRKVSDTVRTFGGQNFVSTQADVLGPLMGHLLRQAQAAAVDPAQWAAEAQRAAVPSARSKFFLNF